MLSVISQAEGRGMHGDQQMEGRWGWGPAPGLGLWTSYPAITLCLLLNGTCCPGPLCPLRWPGVQAPCVPCSDLVSRPLMSPCNYLASSPLMSPALTSCPVSSCPLY